ncbi:glucosamine--fructose-6-phosphate aminotransferase [Sulfuricaulis limicola]|uniref:Glutamine--fructose-6-phosphate aminotransferase [isomerizing] n=1 Tax=Sulfuricaulis limicola TaxID=1620215 RepID=A0A1B4XJT3_9GAMM|nr:glutamine--fructose-6-phosphate transaminase (isomerizing) [Sulfuricaulis limicola]BAV35061.1 glucosamine--fructose-6-phosphate aminotransferase [Sulfuricaulis limicola]
MCGIVGAVAQRNVVPILVEGLKRLEYRGYDSAGLAVLGDGGAERLDRVRAVGKVKALEDSIQQLKTEGQTGIAHTRWATHGVPSEDNAHPHVSHGVIAVVHNGIIENHEKLRTKLQELGYEFTSQTDTEVVAHLVHHHLKKQKDLCKAAMAAIGELEGAYALGIISRDEPHRLIAARKGSPLVVGVGIEERFIGSDVLALAPVTRNVIYLEEGDVADLRRTEHTIYDASGKKVERPVRVSEATADAVDRGQYRNFTEKEIFEQPKAVADTLEGRLGKGRILEEAFGVTAGQIFDNTKAVQIIACGTSFHAGSVARYWIESLAGLPCNVEIASEYRYRKHVVLPGTLVVTISQSGETADTLAALQQTRKLGYGHSLAICNVPESSLVRESELTLLTRAGPEIGVASTKAFVTQLTALLLLTIALARRHGLTAEKEKQLVEELEQLPGRIQKVLELSEEIRALSERFVDKHHALFLGRGVHYPIAMEGALKLKEISYIHAESYAAGELKHGPLALVDANMPVIAVAPNDELLEKLKSNLQEVRARGGELYVFSVKGTGVRASNTTKIRMPEVGEWTSPILYTVPLQLLAYYVALAKGTDVDQPRNLAKSVTVE